MKYGILDKQDNALRVGFVSDSYERLAIDVANDIVEVSLAGSEDTYQEYEGVSIDFKDALDVLKTHGFELVSIPEYIAVLFEDCVSSVVNRSTEFISDCSLIGVFRLGFEESKMISRKEVFVK